MMDKEAIEKILKQVHEIGEEYYSVDHSSGGVSFYEYLARRLCEAGYRLVNPSELPVLSDVPIPKPPLTGTELITIERERQMSKEGWTAEHDDKHTEGELALVAALYATPITLFSKVENGGEVSFIDPWPWWDEIEQTRYSSNTYTYKVKAWDKREKHNKFRKLVIAGALIAAEIDRLQRDADAKWIG